MRLRDMEVKAVFLRGLGTGSKGEFPGTLVHEIYCLVGRIRTLPLFFNSVVEFLQCLKNVLENTTNMIAQ